MRNLARGVNNDVLFFGAFFTYIYIKKIRGLGVGGGVFAQRCIVADMFERSEHWVLSGGGGSPRLARSLGLLLLLLDRRGGLKAEFWGCDEVMRDAPPQPRRGGSRRIGAEEEGGESVARNGRFCSLLLRSREAEPVGHGSASISSHAALLSPAQPPTPPPWHHIPRHSQNLRNGSARGAALRSCAVGLLCHVSHLAL